MLIKQASKLQKMLCVLSKDKKVKRFYQGNKKKGKKDKKNI